MQIVQTDYISVQAEPLVFEVFYKSDTASAAAVYVQYYDADKVGLGQNAATFTDGTGIWRKHSVIIQKEGAVFFKLWLRNLNENATVSYASPTLRLQSEGNVFLNGDMQEYTESGDVITPGGWNLAPGTTGGTIGGVRESDGNVYVSMNAVGAFGTYLQQKTAVIGDTAYRLSFKVRGNLMAPAVEVYFYETGNNTSYTGKQTVAVTAVGTPSETEWTEYETYLTTQANSTTAGDISVWLRNPVADYTAEIDDVNLTVAKTNFTFSEAEGNVTAKAHMVAAAPVTDETAPILIVCAYNGKMLTDVKIVSGEKADAAFTAAGQFTASATVEAAEDAMVKAFAWDGISTMRALGKATK